MKFSIIVPVYNTEKYLAKCIQSIEKQTFEDYELILIDDCSVDESLNVAKKFLKNNVKIYRNEQNLGLSSTRNLGIKKAQGEYILFLDSDDYLDYEALNLLNNIIDENKKPDIIYTGFVEEREYSSTVKYGCVCNKNYLYTNYDFLLEELKARNLYAAACFGVYKRKLLIDNELFFKPKIFHEDELWTPQILSKAKTVYVSDVVYYHYVRRENSITTIKDKTQNGIDLIESCKELLEIFKECNDFKLKRMMDNHIAMLYMKAMCRGKLYRKEYKNLIDRRFPIRNTYTFFDKLKSVLFLISPRIYYFLDLKLGDNEL